MIRLAWEKGLRTLNFGTVKISMRSGRKTGKISSRHDKEHCGKGTSRRIMSLKLKNNVAVLNIGVTNHIFDSLKIGTGNESVVRIRTLDTIVWSSLICKPLSCFVWIEKIIPFIMMCLKV